MPRIGDVYGLPAGSIIANGTTSDAPTQHNAPLNDIAAEQNLVRPVSTGGTGGASATAARAALGLAVGTDVQAFDADLSAIAALTSAANKMPYATGAQAWALADITSGARALVALTGAADKLPYFTGASAAATTDLSAFIRTVLDDASATAALATLGIVLGTASGNVPVLGASGLPAIGGTLLTGVLKSTADYAPADQTITSAATLTLTHSLGSAPSQIEFSLVCQSTDGVFSAGDVLPANMNSSSTAVNRVSRVRQTSAFTTINIRFSDATNCFTSADNAGTFYPLDNTKWQLRVRAWK